MSQARRPRLARTGRSTREGVLVIVLTRLNRTRFAVNPDLIERIQVTPDTTLVMVDGATFVVTEAMDAVIDAVVAFRARVLTAALHGPVAAASDATDGGDL